MEEPDNLRQVGQRVWQGLDPMTWLLLNWRWAAPVAALAIVLAIEEMRMASARSDLAAARKDYQSCVVREAEASVRAAAKHGEAVDASEAAGKRLQANEAAREEADRRETAAAEGRPDAKDLVPGWIDDLLDSLR